MDSIRAHRLRSFLTLLGVVIGVASVVLVGAAIEGLGVTAEKTTSQAFGTDTYLIAQIASAGRLTRKEVADKLKRNRRIRPEDVDYLNISTGDQILYSPYQQRPEDIRYDNAVLEGGIVLGVSPDMADIRDLGIIEGRFFTDQEARNKNQVAVVGDDLRTVLFAGSSPIGKSIKIRGQDFVIIGLQEKLGSSFGRSQDNSVYIPYPVFDRMYGAGRSLSVFGRPKPATGLKLEDGLDITRAALRARFKTPPGQPDNFENLTPDSIRGFIDQILGLISVVVVPVTAISLVVGGIVIMNIMLVSVTERTREIGIRKSLGAKKNDVLLQFLLESMMVSSAGGLLGLALGALICELLASLLDADMKITIPYVFLAVFVSSAVGIISGWYPASRAARLDPIAALRAE